MGSYYEDVRRGGREDEMKRHERLDDVAQGSFVVSYPEEALNGKFSLRAINPL